MSKVGKVLECTNEPFVRTANKHNFRSRLYKQKKKKNAIIMVTNRETESELVVTEIRQT